MNSTAKPHLTVIETRKGWIALDARELWAYRELLFFFSWRDLKVRYKQTLLGAAWAVIDPVITTVVFTILFGRLAQLETDGLPPQIFYLTGLTIWKFFSTTLTMSSNSLVNSSNMLTKIYFPRLVLPLSTCVTGVVDFTIALAALAILMVWLGAIPAATALLAPLLVLLAAGTAIGAGLILSALNVRFRDIRNIVPFLVQIWMYVSVIVPFSQVPERFGAWRYLYGLNPMAGVVEMFRWCMLHHRMNPPAVRNSWGWDLGETHRLTVSLQQSVEGTVPPPLALLVVGIPVTVILLICGLYYFRRVEGQFADII